MNLQSHPMKQDDDLNEALGVVRKYLVALIVHLKPQKKFNQMDPSSNPLEIRLSYHRELCKPR